VVGLGNKERKERKGKGIGNLSLTSINGNRDEGRGREEGVRWVGGSRTRRVGAQLKQV
jgi:hypothetical protein